MAFSTIEEFVEAFLEEPSNDFPNLTIREVLNKTGKVSKTTLIFLMKNFFVTRALQLKIASSTNSLDVGESAISPLSPQDLPNITYATPSEISHSEKKASYNPFTPENHLSPAFIKEFQKQLGTNVIYRHPWKTLAAGIGVGVGAFALSLMILVIMSTVTSVGVIPAVLSFLPFLATLGPLGVAFAFAGLIAAASLVIFGVTVGITAAATTPKSIKIEEDAKTSNQLDKHSSLQANNTGYNSVMFLDLNDARRHVEDFVVPTPAITQLRRQEISSDAIFDQAFSSRGAHSPASVAGAPSTDDAEGEVHQFASTMNHGN
jgi:hypothetical protein